MEQNKSVEQRTAEFLQKVWDERSARLTRGSIPGQRDPVFGNQHESEDREERFDEMLREIEEAVSA